MLLKFVIVACAFVASLGFTQSEQSSQPGSMEGHLRIYSAKTVESADGDIPTVTSRTYAEYPLVILSQDGKKEISSIVADSNGNYRVTLPPGAYMLDVQDRIRKHVRAKPKPFTVVSGQTVRVDLEMDTGIR